MLGKNIVTIVTDAKLHRKDGVERAKVMKQKGVFIIRSSGVFGRAASEYRTIFDPALNRACMVAERLREFLQIKM
ncbi:TPA: hypothetical protein ACGU4V_004453 [Vibrio vulnificus]